MALQTDIIVRNFFRLILAGAFGQERQIEPMSAWKWKRLYHYSVINGVAAIVANGLSLCRNQFFAQQTGEMAETWQKAISQTQEASRRQNMIAAELLGLYAHRQLRPILLQGQALACLYVQPDYRSPDEAITIFFPFATQGAKADGWAKEHGSDVDEQTKHVLMFRYQDIVVRHRHNLLQMANALHNRALQNIVQKEMRESAPTFLQTCDTRVETLSPTLTLLHLLLSIATSMLNAGVAASQLVDLGLYLRKLGDRVDYVKLQDWLSAIGMQRMASLAGTMLIQMLDFSADEIPFLTTRPEASVVMAVTDDLFSLQKSRGGQWYFEQGDGIFVGTKHSSAMLWQVHHSARYITYCPAESISNFFSSFVHSLSHIEE